MAELNRTPNPAGSPIEKLITETALENLDPAIQQILSNENPTREEILRVFSLLTTTLRQENLRQNRLLEEWANIHTHPDGGSGGQSYLNIWETVTTSPTEGPLGTAAVYDGKLYVFGPSGSSLSSYYDPASNTWTPIADTPFVSPTRFAAALSSGKILVGPGSAGTIGQHLNEYDPATDTYTRLADLPNTGYTTAVVVGDVLYAIRNTGSAFAKYERDIDTWTVLTAGTLGLNYTSLATDGTDVWALGGQTETDAHKFDVAAGTWSAVAPLPSARGNAGVATGIDGRFYLIGGNYGANPSMLSYDPIADTWESHSDAPTNINESVGVGAVGSKIIVACGTVPGTGSYSGKTQVYS